MEPKDTAKPASSIADSAARAQAQADHRYAGILVHHGAAPSEDDSTHQGNYYVILKTDAGEQTLWAPGLEQAMQETAVKAGEPIMLASESVGSAVTWRARSIDAATLETMPFATPASISPAAQSSAMPATSLAPELLQAIMSVVSPKEPEQTNLDPGDIQRMNDSLKGDEAKPIALPQPPENGAETLLKGTAQLAEGVASLTGAAMQGLGRGASALAGALSGSGTEKGDTAPVMAAPDALAGRVPVLPRLSEYRVDQVEKAGNNYHKAHEAFWAADKMPEVHRGIENRANEAGLTVTQVIEKMKPDGEYSDLHQTFVNAVAQSPEAQGNKKVMDKALTGWAKQYGRAQEELLNPETEGNPHYEKLKDRLETSSAKMHQDAGNTPAFAGEGQSHIERLREVMERIAERLKEVVKGIVDLVRNSLPGSSRDNDFAP